MRDEAFAGLERGTLSETLEIARGLPPENIRRYWGGGGVGEKMVAHDPLTFNRVPIHVLHVEQPMRINFRVGRPGSSDLGPC
jgi:hypothetical protein